jgi:hypothetical protein
MSGVQEISIAESYESKLDAVLKAIKALTAITGALENLASGIDTSQGAEIMAISRKELFQSKSRWWYCKL